jgi:replication-associated recombination protein RarA
MVRTKPYNHARILYGSYGTGKSHFFTVLSQILGKTFTDGVAYSTFVARVREYDDALANDIESYINTAERKPLLIVPIVFDFEDFDRCIYFLLRKSWMRWDIK